jgi:lipopolysaccharide biosynthesis protein
MTKSKIRAITIYLPQFHPIPENDEWWGKGFTEWTNVTKAKPLFKGHYQPHLPADLGFYDLRLAETRQAQAELAKKYGIHGFCYYHYWFNGRRILNEPLDRMLQLKEPDFPFMYCWANENWTRRWDGNSNEILLEQKYSIEDHKDHMVWLCENVFSDSRYITVNGAPVFVIYRADIIPNIDDTIKIWRETAAKKGFKNIYICSLKSMGSDGVNPQNNGFDASIEFQPDWTHLQKTDKWTLFKYKYNINVGKNTVFEYDDYIKRMLAKEIPAFKEFPAVNPSWDNSARKKKFGFLFKNSTPAKFKYWFKEVMARFKPFSEEENFVFIIAWNEWAEGNHLEPDQKYGTGYLEAVKEVLDIYNT